MTPAATPRKRGATRCGEDALLALMLLMAGLLVVTTVPPRAGAATLCVGGAGPGNYTTIQEAVDAASPGDTICVYSGTYVENVVIAKTLTLVGEDRNTTVIDGGGAGTVLNVSADWVNVSGFTVRNGALDWPYAGIQLFNAGHVRIFDNMVAARNAYGIRVVSSHDSILSRNAVSGSYQESEIWVSSSANVTLANNTVVTNGTGGVAIYGSTGAVLADNSIEWRAGVQWTIGFDAIRLSSLGATLVNNAMIGSGISLSGNLVEYWNTHEIDTSNTVNGRPVVYLKNVTGGTVPPGAGQVLLANATGVLVTGQVLANTTAGLQLGFSRNNTVTDNTVLEIHDDGIRLWRSANNTIANNSVTGDPVVRISTGVSLGDSDGNVVSNNTFADAVGISLFRSRNNTLTSNVGVPGVTDWSTLVQLEWGAEFNLVENNTAQFDRGGGLYVHYGANNTIRYNKFAVRGSGGAISLFGAANNLLTDNLISNSGMGIYVQDGGFGASFGNRIYHNVFANISGLLAWDEGGNDSWDDGYPSGGNYWSNYTGVDDCSGPNQDVCPDPDGVGDTPYGIPLASRDRYPLMGPGPMSRPLAPEGLTASGDPTRVQLAWSPPASPGGSPISGYRIYRGTSPGVETFLTETGDVTSHADADVTIGLTYFYRLAAVNAGGEGAVTPEVNATVGVSPPSEPRNLAASGGDRQITLTWSTPVSDGGSPLTGYRVYRGDLPGGETVLLDLGPVTSHTDTGLSNGRAYYYQVAAMNAAGVGPRSAEVNAIPAAIPGPPTGVVAIPGDQTVTLSWSAPADAGGSPITNYRIYRGTAPGGTTYLATVGNVLTHADTGLGNGVPYFYEVAAVNGVGEGPRSAEVSATPRTTPTEPRNLAIRGGDGRLSLTWDPPQSDGGSPITTYRIYRGLSPGAEILLAETADVSYDDTGLTNGLTYSYRVAATNAAGEGRSSLSVGATPLMPPTVVAVARASAEVRVGERVTFDGSESAGDITRYEWTIRNERGAIVAVLGGRTADYVFRNAGHYTVTLIVFDDANQLRAEDTLTVVVVGGLDLLPILVLAALFAAALAGSTERARVTLLVLVASAFRRKAEEDPDTRGMIRGYVLVHPGDTYAEIKRNLRLSNGQAAWHLAKLEKEGILRSRAQGTHRRYYPAKELPPLENGGDLHEVQRRLVRIAREHPGLAVTVLAGELRVSRQLALYHLRALSRIGLVSLERRGVHLRIFPGEPD